MTARRHRRYSTEFKIQLVQAYLDGEGSVRKIATRRDRMVKSRVVCKSERKLLDASVRLPWRPPSVREA